MKYTNDQLELLLKQVYSYYVYNDVKQSYKALELIEIILANPDHSELHLRANLVKGELLLASGDFKNGLPLYELWRTKSKEFNFVRNNNFWTHEKKRWNGKCTNDFVIIWQDQGFGDTIQHARYIPMILEKAPNAFVAVQEPLYDLIYQSFSQLKIKPRIINNDEIQVEGIANKDALLNFPLSQALLLFETTIDTIPNKIPYLISSNWLDETKKIGWCWESGNKWHKAHLKSIPYIWIEPLIKEFGGISLQLDDLDVDSFAQTAAIINNLDLIITVDTAIAHLAGALGKPVWILLHNQADWRWLRDRTDSPWYPTAKLFRQLYPGDWDVVLNEIKNELRT